MGHRLQSQMVDRHHCVVSVASSAEQKMLLSHDRCCLDDKPIRLCATQYDMGGDELLAFVRNQLEMQEEYNRRHKLLASGATAQPPTVDRSRARGTNIMATREENTAARQVPGQNAWNAGHQTPPPQRGRSPSRTGAGEPPMGKGKGKGGMATPQPPVVRRPGWVDAPPGRCWLCWRDKRADEHQWRECPNRRQFFEERDARMAALGLMPPRGGSNTPGRRSQSPGRPNQPTTGAISTSGALGNGGGQGATSSNQQQ